MNALRRLWTAAALGLLVASSPLVTSCAGAAGEGKTAKVEAGDMPSNATWTGVYFSELYGMLHIVQKGTTIEGKWERPHKERWGELHGEASGDLVKFTWSEYVRGLVGPNAKHEGKGYFKYKRPAGDNVDDTIAGETGRDNDEVGDPWDAIKQRNVKPDLASIGGSGASDVGGGDWDSDNHEKGKPEKPAPPP
jgi:hypothetical protein